MKLMVSAVLAAVVMLAGCKPGAAVREGKPIGNGVKSLPAVPVDPAIAGAISGTVDFAGKPPERVRIDMSQDPACTLGDEENYSEQYVVHEGRLANVFVYVKSGPPAAMTAPLAGTNRAVMDQKGCRYTPHVVAVMKGGTVEFRNSDVTMHNIHTMPAVVGNGAVDISQGPKGAPQSKTFTAAELMIPVRCNNHPWMNAFINVADNPFFAVTGPDGKFQISGLPEGAYTLAAVHEKLGEQTFQVVVKPHDTAEAHFKFAMK